jgi:hypothetical protein
MKKLLFSVAMLAAGAAAYAQKPTSGSITVESVFDFNLNGINQFNTPEARVRYFLSDDLAARVRLGLNSSSSTVKIDNGNAAALETGEIKTSSFGFNLGLGAEKHFGGSDKLSPYVGAEIALRSQGASLIDAKGSDNGTIWSAKDDTYKTEGGGSFTFGINLLFGADYYITDAVYIGGEMGFLFGSTSTSELKFTKKSGGAETKGTVANESSNTTMNIASNVGGGIRLGIKF